MRQWQTDHHVSHSSRKSINNKYFNGDNSYFYDLGLLAHFLVGQACRAENSLAGWAEKLPLSDGSRLDLVWGDLRGKHMHVGVSGSYHIKAYKLQIAVDLQRIRPWLT